MPEHEIAKHTKAIYNTLHESRKSLREKAVEIFIEIAIIVFAITLSLLLERWRENSHERTLEKKFLIGLKQDLKNDIEQLKSDSTSYSYVLNGWDYMRTMGMSSRVLNGDSLKKYGWTLNNTSDFIANSSRFEALKSSGQLDVIEDDSLKALILDIYQNRIKVLQISTTFFSHFKSDQLLPFLARNVRIRSNGENNISELVKNPEMQNYLLLGNVSSEIMDRYHSVIMQSDEIIKMINKQYNLK